MFVTKWSWHLGEYRTCLALGIGAWPKGPCIFISQQGASSCYRERLRCPCQGWLLLRLLGHIPGACIRPCRRACGGCIRSYTGCNVRKPPKVSLFARICLYTHVAYHHKAGGRAALPCASRWLPHPLLLLCLLVRLDHQTFTCIRASAQVCARLCRSYPSL